MGTIRDIRSSDLPHIRKIIYRIFNRSDAHRAWKTIESHIRFRKYGIYDGRKFWVLRINNKIVGFVGLSNRTHFQYALDWFGVDMKYQGKGYGSMLLKYAITQAKRLKAKILYVEGGTLEEFEKSHKLYKKFRFGKLPLRIKDFWGKRDDLILFIKKI